MPQWVLIRRPRYNFAESRLYEWVKGGEFVLTTWYAFSLRPDLQEKNFEKLAGSISAIGIKLGRFIQKVPDSIVKICDKYNLPLFIVYKEVKFRELILTINSEIQNSQTNMLIQVERFYKDLTQVSLESDRIEPFIQLLGKRIRKTCIFVDNDMKILTSYSDGEKIDDNWIEKHVSRAQIEKAFIISGYIANDIYVIPCHARGVILGSLMIYPCQNITEKERLMIQQTASFLTMKYWSVYDSKQKKILRIWNELKYGNFENEKLVLEYIRIFSKHSSQGYDMIFFSKDVRFDLLTDYVNKRLYYKLLIEEEPWYIVILPHRDLKKFREEMEHEFANTKIIIAPTFDDLHDIRDRYQFVQQINMIVDLIDIRGVINSEDWIVYSMILQNRRSPEYHYIYKNVLFPLQMYDSNNNGQLLETLKSVINGNSLEETSKNMHVHVNTIRYRINKIMELTGKNYFHKQDKMILLVACIINNFERGD